MIEEALLKYDFHEAKATLIRHNENMTYAVTTASSKYLLRIHKAAEGLDFSFLCGKTPRYNFIESEIQLLLKLGKDLDILTQKPIKNKNGEYISKLASGNYVTVLMWIYGEDFKNISINNEIVYEIGKLTGQLHNKMSELPLLKRYNYDGEVIQRVSHEIDNAYKMKNINEKHYNSITAYLHGFSAFIKKEKKNFILVHADLSKSNLIYNKKLISPIDFSLSGYALPEMDLADMICSLNDKNLNSYLMNGYKSISKYSVSDYYVDMYIAFSIILYISYHHNKLKNDEKSQKSLDRWTNTIIKPMNERMSEINI